MDNLAQNKLQLNDFLMMGIKVDKLMDDIGAAYYHLTNTSNSREALECLGIVTLASREAAEALRKALVDKDIPLSEIRNVTNKTLDTLDSKWLNCTHYYQRFLHSDPAHTLKNLTAFYYLMKELSEIALETKVDRYAQRS